MKKTENIYYKYRSIDNFKRFLDIILNKRLYGCTYQELNDPMEGHFLYPTQLAPQLKPILIDKLKSKLICSPSIDYNIGLMWSHYANSHTGCCIGFELGETKKWKKLEVEYKDTLPSCASLNDIEQVLKTKSSHWGYEKEVRFIKDKSDKSTRTMPIKIKEIYLGTRMHDKDKRLIKKLIKSIYGDKVNVSDISFNEIDFGFQKP